MNHDQQACYTHSVRQRLLLVITDLEIGGTPTVARELAIRLRDANTHVEVACLGRHAPVAAQMEAAGVRVTPLGASSASEVWIIRRLSDLIREHRIDTVLSFLVHANAVAAAAKPSCPGVRFFQSIQTTQAKPAWHWRVQRFVHHAAQKIIVPSDSVAQIALSRAKAPADKVIVIPNAIDPADFAPSPIPPTDPRPFPIGFIGRLDPIKMVGDLLAAVARLDGLVHLHIYGDGAQRQILRRTIGALDLARHVTMHGAIAHPQEALRQIGLLALPSLAEGFGLVLIEAMAARVPVIARNVPGVRDVVRHDQTGILVDSLLVPPLAEAIGRVVKDRDLRARLTTAAYADVVARFAWPPVLEQYRAVLFGESAIRSVGPHVGVDGDLDGGV
jgi:glycosyltransferase involved in cell wall biosynthesis